MADSLMIFDFAKTQQESARQKKAGVSEDVEEVTAFILDHFNFIKNWVVQHAQSPTEPDKSVSCRRSSLPTPPGPSHNCKTVILEGF